ncbi:serine/threonine protein kinase [Rhodobacter sp.]
MADPDLERAVEAALEAAPARVQPSDLPDGRRFWLKQVERLAGRMRLQKGDPARSFAAEREGIRALQHLGLPVAGLAMEGPGWFVLPDAGPVLPQVVADPALDDAGKLAAMAAAGRALASVHRAALVHGRPAVRDICWDGAQIRFIDLERFHEARVGGWRQAADLTVLAQSAFTRWPDDPRWILAAFAGYREAGPALALRRAGLLAALLTPLGWLGRLVLVLRPRSKEVRAMVLVLPWLRRQG